VTPTEPSFATAQTRQSDPSASDATPAALSVALTLTSDQLDAIAELVAARLDGGTRTDSGWLRGAERIAAYIDCPRSRVYALTSAGRIPIERDGSNLVARKSDLDAWLRAGGAKRP
jgi:excisionase family DNA binding protein